VLLTREIDETIRCAELLGIRSAIEAARRLRPDIAAEAIEIAGGLIAFMGSESPLSEVFGLGTAPVATDEIAAITNFYESRDTTPRVFVSPLAHSTLGSGLAAAGYAPAEYENVLASDDFQTSGGRDERIRATSDVDGWARASAAAFMGCEDPAPSDDLIARVIASSNGVCALEVWEDDRIAATAAMDLRGECAAFFAASTAPAFRRRGWHKALIEDRVARAGASGAHFMRATARPASTSERNFHRCGFVTLYTRSLWERRRSTQAPR
jgi:GNAT superfamily N-acetyltransferase